MNIKIFLLTITALFFSFQILLAQTAEEEPETTENIDTVLNKQEENTLEILKQADSLRVHDSLEKILLQRQMEELKTYETSKRKQLEEKLLEIEKADSIRKSRAKLYIDSLRTNAVGYPACPFEDTLFYIYSKTGAFSPTERVQRLERKVRELESNKLFKPDSIKVIDNEFSSDIIAGDVVLLSITEKDELWEGKSKIDIAGEYQKLIVQDMINYRKDHNLITLAKQIGLALLVIIIQFMLIKLVNYVFKLLNKRVESQKDKRIKGVKLKNYDFLNADSQVKLILFGTKILRFIVNGIQLYITIPLIFAIFPLTRDIASRLFGYVVEPLKMVFWSVVNYLPNLITIIVIYYIFKYIVKGIKYLADEIKNEKLQLSGFYPEWASPTYNIMRFILYAFMFIMIFQYLPGSDTDIFKGVSVFIGVIFSIGSSSVVGNIVAGLVITYMRPFKIGDRIKIGDVQGNVIEKTAFVTRIRTPKNEEITIPNSSILASHTTNFTSTVKESGIVLYTTVTIGYDVPWRKVHELLINAAKKTDYVRESPSPFVLQTSLDDFYVSYQLNIYTKETNRQAEIYSKLHQSIQDTFFEAGVEILSPHYRAPRDGNMTTIPEQYLDDNYTPPSFRVENINNQ